MATKIKENAAIDGYVERSKIGKIKVPHRRNPKVKNLSGRIGLNFLFSILNLFTQELTIQYIHDS